MARKKGRNILPFRIPFFRIFYSGTYTALYILEICLLAITPISIIWTAIEQRAYQYITMVGGAYILTAFFAIFIYTSRLYTNRSVLAAVGKAYIPVEEGEVGKNVRKMIVKQLQRSAIVAWESKPRDLEGEILQAEQTGLLPEETTSVGHDDYVVGTIIPVDPANPPWGHIRHEGWSSPSHRDDNKNPDVQFAEVIAELPNLIEARAVSLAPPDPLMTPIGGQPVADLAVVELLRRQETMGLRDYLTQLSYLGLINPPETAQSFLRRYERARFCGRPITETDFNDLMADFSVLLSGMMELQPAIVEQIRAQVGMPAPSDASSVAPSQAESFVQSKTSPLPPAYSPDSNLLSPTTARERPSPSYHQAPSQESLSSVIHRVPDTPASPVTAREALSAYSRSQESLGSVLHRAPSSSASFAGSVLRHRREDEGD